MNNTSRVFDRNPDFLKRGKLMMPSIGIKGEEAYQRLGKFYSDTWEFGNDSQFITCKGYDIMYGLQNITLNMPYTGSVESGFYQRPFSSAYDAFVAVFDEINYEKHRNEIYGADVEFVVDEQLTNIAFPNPFFEEKTAWEVLQELADYSLSHVHTDREGIVRVVCDIPPNPPAKTPRGDLYIAPNNSFSYSLPIQSKTIVNKINVPYRYTVDGNPEDNTIQIGKEKIITQDGAMTFSVDLVNYYPNGFRFVLRKVIGHSPTDIYSSIQSVRAYYNKIYFTTSVITCFDSLELEIKPISNVSKVFKEDVYSYQKNDGMASIKKNGVCLLEFPSTPFTDGAAAQRIATSIIGKYNDGVEYVETDWIGTPELEIGDVIRCASLREERENGYQAYPDERMALYESYSNEFTLDGGLRVKSKLRKF